MDNLNVVPTLSLLNVGLSTYMFVVINIPHVGHDFRVLIGFSWHCLMH